MRAFIYLLPLALLLPACKQYTPANLPPERLHFATKGGLTGGGREYILLLDSGRLLFTDEYAEGLEKIGKFTKAELAAVRADLEGIAFAKHQSTTGNYNTSLTYHHAGTTDRLNWKRPGDAPSAAVESCYADLLTAVRRLRKTDQ